MTTDEHRQTEIARLTRELYQRAVERVGGQPSIADDTCDNVLAAELARMWATETVEREQEGD